PWLFTIFFFTLELWLLIEACERQRVVWLVPVAPLLALWANLHIEFVLGLGLIGLFALQQMIPAPSKWAFGSGLPGRHLPAAWLWGLLAASCTATLANPYGWRLYEVVADYSTQKAPLQVVSEMQPISFRNFTEWATLLLVCGGWFALGTLRKRPALLLILLAVSCWFGFRAQREVWFPILTSTLIIAYRSRETDSEKHPFPRSYWAVTAATTGLFTVAVFGGATRPNSELQKAVGEHYPAAASAFVESHAMHGPLYNSYQWGGYLSWRLPNMPVSIDGRANLHGDDRIFRSVRTGFAGRDWAEDQEFRKAKTIILEDDSPLASVLRSDRRYRLLYEDKVASVFEPAQ
ncbi:MAG TPA: hypothetical protein VNH18_08530, partial [Bryobacteraceae bacterium]|nr:hypothetical protein [Bryobacteraceae bacterium]